MNSMAYKDGGALIGLENGHYAVLKTDSKETLEYDKVHGTGGVKRFYKLTSASVSPKSDMGKFYADNMLDETAVAMGEIDVTISAKDVPLEDRAIMFGSKLDKGVIRESSEDTAPYIAFGFSVNKSRGGKYHFWIVKGMAQPVEQDVSTKEDSISFQTPELVITGMPRAHDGVWRIIGDSDAEDFVGEEKFFTVGFLEEQIEASKSKK